MKRSAAFRQNDLVRALKAAKLAGCDVEIEIYHDHMVVKPAKQAAESSNEDEVERWLGKHAHKS
jgi:hypothetical protein